ncbi:lambda exonuclease family protein [Methylopila sp. 73B]|uniref:lambda exonuclease family protein n=1 Tax=Methylopila sp. 73B TaxID=1120792 RepID=UPI00037480D7|nr:lambda exonuclease family protein [Methylopila sp. 73B]
MRIIDCEQGSPEWFAARAGMPTASEFSTVMAKGKEGGASKMRRTYMLKLAGEILTGDPMEGFSNSHTDRGHEMEPEARDLYSFVADVEPERVGFIVNGAKGASPDSLIGDVGALEIKTKLPHLLIDVLLRDEFPADHKAQCQGVLWVAEREWIDIAVYWPRLPLFVKRAYRDEPYIKAMSDAVDAFNDELHELVEKVRRYGGAGLSEAA